VLSVLSVALVIVLAIQLIEGAHLTKLAPPLQPPPAAPGALVST
jgi:hypothetical protein